MAKAKKLPSGNWNVRVWYTEDGRHKSKSFTADTRAKAEFAASQFKITPNKSTGKKTVRQAVEEYIELSRQILSPTTIVGYEKVLRTSFQSLMDVQVDDLTDSVLQSAINAECKRPQRRGGTLSTKSVKNSWGVIASALRTVCDRTYKVRLPKVQHKNENLPNPQEIIDIIQGSDIELPCLLAMWMSFSMSEIRGIKCSSIRDGYICIDQVVVDVGTTPIEKKNAKTDTRIRQNVAPDYILHLIAETEVYKNYQKTKQDNYLIQMSGWDIYRKFKRLTKAHGLNLRFHDLRHIFASVSLNILGLPEKIVMDAGGWSTPSVMKRVYSQGFDEARNDANKRLNDYYNSLLNP